QQVFLSALLRKVTSDGTLSNPITLYKLAGAALSNMTLSDGLAQARTLVGLAGALRGMSTANMLFVQYPGTTGGTGVYAGKVQPSTELAAQLFTKIKADQSFSLGADSTGIGSE
ncbi:LytR family transcriptional regulator, partial [Bacillus sp. S34]|nr:LytR family transcriptional regulator [Bacillus sp. S34]